MKPVFTISALLIFSGLALIYLKAYGWDEFAKFLMNNALGVCLAFVGGGLLADIIREAKN